MTLGIARAGAQAAPDKGSARPAGYQVDRTVTLPDSGGWDYLGFDNGARKLYVSAGSQEDVLDADSLKLVGTVGGLQGTHGVAVAEKDGHGFTSNGGSASFTMFDLKTLQTLKEIPLPIQRPDGIIYDPASDRVFAFNHTAQAVAVDAETGEVVGTVALPSKASEYAVADGRGHIFNNLEDSSVELEIDAT